jgi:flagellar biosynthesis protein FlhF
METLTDNQSGSKSGKRFRLTVKSAEEAVRVIREKLGDRAKVLSVKQIGGVGLKKFISSPKLEVIAEIPPEEEDGEVSKLDDTIGQSADTKANLGDMAPPQDEPKPVSRNQNVENEEDADAKNIDSNSFDILDKTGFDSQLLSDIKLWSNWPDIKGFTSCGNFKRSNNRIVRSISFHQLYTYP